MKLDMAIRMYTADGRKGCVQLRRAKSTGTTVGVYNCEQAALDTDGGPWATVCDDHGSICNHDTLKVAREHASAPEGWCEECLAALEKIPDPLPLPFDFAEAAGSRDDEGRECCMRCGRAVDHGRGCDVHIHGGGSVILAARATTKDLDPAADLGLWVLGPECQRHVPEAYRRPRSPLRTAVAPEATTVTTGVPCIGLSGKGAL